MSTTLPVKTKLALAVPSPVVNVRPVRPDSVRRPCDTLRVTCRLPLPASRSLTEIRLPLLDENTRAVSSLTNWAAGTALTGASLTEFTVIATVLLADKAPPLPVLPRSEVSRLSVSVP